MCQLKSCLVLKDRVFCPAYNSHQSMLAELKINDNETTAAKTFVRVELLPPDGEKGLPQPLGIWTLKVDQDIRPDWWDEAAYRPMIEEAVEAWRREHVFTEGEYKVTGSETCYAFDTATVWAFDTATVWAFDTATVRASGNATVRASDTVTVIWPLLKKAIVPEGWTVETHPINPPEDTQG